MHGRPVAPGGATDAFGTMGAPSVPNLSFTCTSRVGLVRSVGLCGFGWLGRLAWLGRLVMMTARQKIDAGPHSLSSRFGGVEETCQSARE